MAGNSRNRSILQGAQLEGADAGLTSGSDSERPDAIAARIRAESNERRDRRRGVGKGPRTKISVCTMLAASPVAGRNKYRCLVCSAHIVFSLQSSSNIVAHFKVHHKFVAESVQSASSLDEKRAVKEKAVARSRKAHSVFTNLRQKKPATNASKDVVRRVTGILLTASRQISMDILGAPELEAFIHCCGGTVEKSKQKYVKILPSVYKSVSKRIAREKGTVKIGSFTYDGWSARIGAAISGVPFDFIDKSWKMQCMPLCFFDTQDMGKTAEVYERIMRAAISSNDKLHSDVLLFSVNSDNEAAVALGVDCYLSFRGQIPCF